MRERELQTQILKLLKEHGIFAFGINRERAGKRASHVGVKGLPDIMGWLPKAIPWGATPLYIEVKRPKGKLTKEQAAFLKRAQEDGCIVFKAESLEDVKKEMGWV